MRFFAHLVLFLRLLDLPRPPPDVTSNALLRAYVEVLEEQGAENGLIALYASSLEPESATQSYAHYLKLMDMHTPAEVRRTALQKASEHHLDTDAVARTSVAMIFDEVFPVSAARAPSWTRTHAATSEHGLIALERRACHVLRRRS